MNPIQLQHLLDLQKNVDGWFEGPLLDEAARQFPLTPDSAFISSTEPTPAGDRAIIQKRKWWMFWRRLQALGSEVKELEAETPWKWWKPMVPDTQKVLEELIDVLFFFLSLCNTLGLTAEDIQREYQRKYDINHARATKLGHIK